MRKNKNRMNDQLTPLTPLVDPVVMCISPASLVLMVGDSKASTTNVVNISARIILGEKRMKMVQHSADGFYFQTLAGCYEKLLAVTLIKNKRILTVT